MTWYGDFWPIILEKMYAKIIGSYMKIEGGKPESILHYLSGAPVFASDTVDLTE